MVIDSLVHSAARGFAKPSRSFCIILHGRCLSAVIIWPVSYSSSALTLPFFVSLSLSLCLSSWSCFSNALAPQPCYYSWHSLCILIKHIGSCFPYFHAGLLSGFLLPLHSSTALCLCLYLYCGSASESQLSSWPDYEHDVP